MKQTRAGQCCASTPPFAQPEEGYDAERAAHGALGGREPWLLEGVYLQQGLAVLEFERGLSGSRSSNALLAKRDVLGSTPAT